MEKGAEIPIFVFWKTYNTRLKRNRPKVHAKGGIIITIMKTNRLILKLLALSIPLVLSCCSREERTAENEIPEMSPTVYTFRAVIGDDVKTSVGETGAVSWTAGDQIAVWDGVGERFCTFTSEAGDGIFVFEGEPGVTYRFTQAVYPVSMAKDTQTVTLPSTYTLEEAASGSLYPMLAYVDAESDVLQFKHLGALLRYTVQGVPAEATALVLSSAETSLSGDFAIEPAGIGGGTVSADGEDISAGGSIPTRSGEAPEEIHSAAGEGTVTVSLTPGTRRNLTVYFPLPVGAYSCRLEIKDGDNLIQSHTTATLKDILRKKMVRINCVASVFESGKGTPEDPYLIGTPDDLSLFSSLAADAPYNSACYKLSADLDMSGISDYVPVGGTVYETRFTGNLDGDGHTIRNLSVSASSHAGLFGYLGGTVKDLTIENARIASTGNYAAAIAAVICDATIEGCRVDANTTISADGYLAGSIAGLVRSGTINACASHANVSARQAVGGIAGCVNPTAKGQHALVINCTYEPAYLDGKLARACLQSTAAVAYMGGIVGSATFYADLTGDYFTPDDASIRIVNCYAYPLELASTQSASTAIYHIGGIVGRMDGATTVYNCISPITYSNVLRSGTRVNASNYSGLTSAAAIVGRVYTAGTTVTRTFSSQAWRKVYGNPGSVDVAHSKNTVHLGDGNLRGLDTTLLNDEAFTAEDGGVAAALNAGAAEWNAASPDVEALTWAYDPTFGYPKPQGVDFPGVVTKKVSIIGDSISTYDGFMFANDSYQQNKHYPNTSKAGQYSNMIMNEQYTWWWRLIYGKMTNARLEANNAWGGTTVSYVTEQTEHMPAAPTASCKANSFQKRYIDHGLGNPDVLFYFGGRNDYAYIGGNSHDLLGEYTDEALQTAFDAPAPTLYNNYSQGTVAILKHFHDAHPSAKIMLIITDLMTDEYEDATEAIRAFLDGKGYDIRFANLHKRGTTNSQNTDIGVPKEEGSHPNAVGCENIANYIWDQLGSWLENE